MKFWRLSVEWLRPAQPPPSPFTTAALALEDFASYPDNSIVRNQRTGENVWVRPTTRHPAMIVRGIGSVGPLPVRADDEWLLLQTVAFVP